MFTPSTMNMRLFKYLAHLPICLVGLLLLLLFLILHNSLKLFIIWCALSWHCALAFHLFVYPCNVSKIYAWLCRKPIKLNEKQAMLAIPLSHKKNHCSAYNFWTIKCMNSAFALSLFFHIKTASKQIIFFYTHSSHHAYAKQIAKQIHTNAGHNYELHVNGLIFFPATSNLIEKYLCNFSFEFVSMHEKSQNISQMLLFVAYWKKTGDTILQFPFSA